MIPEVFRDLKKLRALQYDSLIDPSTIFSLEIFRNSDAKAKDMEYFLTIDSWNEKGLVLHVNFTNPLKISSGTFNDQANFRVLDTNFFVSADSGEVLNESSGVPQPRISIPTQLPQGIT